MLWVIREVQLSYGRVSLVKGEVMLLPVPRICNEGAHDGFFIEVGDDSLGDLYPRPFDYGVWVVDPSRLVDPAELGQIQ